MNRKDIGAVVIVGAGVGLLIQPILANNLPNYHLSILARVGILIFFILFAPLALWTSYRISKLWKSFYQFAQFAAVGTLNSFIDVGVFNLETFLYGTSIIGNGLFALFKAISFICGTTNSFVWNKYWTFSAQEKPKAGEVTAFYAIAIIGWVLNVIVATLVKADGPLNSRVWVNIVAPFCGIAVSFIWNFFGYKYFVFKKKGTVAVAS